MRRLVFGVVATCSLGLIAGAPATAQEIGSAQATVRFEAEHPGVGIYREPDGRIARIFGPAFSTGRSPEHSVDTFLRRHGEMLGDIGELELQPIQPDANPALGVMWLADEARFRFRLLNYQQQVDGIDVFRGALRVLVVDEPSYPAVLASVDLRDVSRLAEGAAAGEARVNSRMRRRARQTVGDDGQVVGQSRTVIWAGVDGMVVEPRLAVVFTMENGTPADPDNYDKRLFVADAATGRLLYQESEVLHFNSAQTDIFGNVSGMATEGIGADICAPESAVGLPYVRVNVVGGGTAFADVNGDFIIPNGGAAQVTVQSRPAGRYFNMSTDAGAVETLSQSVIPPGPANFLHNAANNDELIRAQVNAYLHANIARDTLLAYFPNYPTIANQTGFDINVNINSTCNAFYNGDSINFYTSGGGCSNTANSTVVYHEYGHHIVAKGGSGQGAYGEGMSDCVAVVITDDPRLGLGFRNNCSSPLRNADNNCQYQTSGCSSCGSAIHSCGQLISGCVWDLRQSLLATEPTAYLDILRLLTFSSVPLHNGSSITPAITIDFLTLDDDDGDISNGTPHYAEIADAFGQHNMDAPPLPDLLFDYPSGRPDLVSPGGGTTFLVEVLPNIETPEPGTGIFHVDAGGGFQQIVMNEVSANLYEVAMPASPCGTTLRWYVSAETTTGDLVTNPDSAPTNAYTAVSATGTILVDDFETNQGWTVQDVNLQTGTWQRTTPTRGGARGDPPSDFDGSGQCYVTDNGFEVDVDGGPTRLLSPVFDASGGGVTFSYARWFFNDDGDIDRLTVEISNDGGSTWTLVESVGDNGVGGWVLRTFQVASITTPTATMQLRFSATDNPNDSVTEAAIDAVTITSCEGSVTDLVDFDVTFGTLLDGGLAELSASDDDRMRVQSLFGFSAKEPHLMVLDVGAVTTNTNGSTVDISVEGLLSQNGGVATILARNWNTGQFEQIGQYAIGVTETTESFAGLDAATYVRAADGRIEVRVKTVALIVLTSRGFETGIDLVELNVN